MLAYAQKGVDGWELRKKPQWFDSEKNLIDSDEAFAENGIYPIEDKKPSYDPNKEKVERKSKEDWVLEDNKVKVTYTVTAKTLDEVKETKIKHIEAERVARTELMPYTTPDDKEVEVKLREESPNKPRQTWLSGKANKADSRIRRNLDMDDVEGDKYLIAADDSRHEMTADDWLDLGEKIDSWITGHVFAASQHMQAVKDLETVQEVIDYDFSDGWPS